MQPCSREMQALMIQQQSLMSLQDLQNGQQMHHNDSSSQMSSHFDPASSHDDFLDQMLSTLPSSCSWPELSGATPKSLPWEDQFEDQSTFLASKLRQHQITAAGGGNQTNAAAKSLMLQQQLMLSRGLGGGLRSPTGAPGCGESGFIPMPLSLTSADSYDQSQNDISQGGNNSVQALFNGFNGGLNQPQHFHNPQGGTIQAQNFGAPSPVMNQAPANGSAGGAPAQPRQRVRARRGQATDPHSIAERLRRERIAERMKSLQELVPNGNKTDKASMLDEIIDYVKFLQLQVKVLSMSRLGGAGPVAPLVTTDISPEGGGDCVQGSGGTGGRSTQTAASSSNDSMTVTEHQVAKLMEEDMGSAMQYLQGKGLCLMPISLATAISTATCQPTTRNNFHHPLTNPRLQSNGEGGATSPTMSVLTVQSASMGNGLTEASVKDATSVSKP